MHSLSSLVRSHGSSFSSLFVFPLFLLLILAGCSGDDVQIELTGKIDQNFSAGTKACLDSSGNGRRDADEPAALTKSDGTYTLTVPAASLDKFPLIVESALPSGTSQKTVKLSAPAGKYTFVSPISTAVQNEVEQGNSVAEAETAVRTRYSLPDDVDLYADYQESPVDSEKAQVLVKVAEEVVRDYGIEVEEGAAAEDTDETTASQRVVRYSTAAAAKSATVASSASTESEADGEVAGGSSSSKVVKVADSSAVSTASAVAATSGMSPGSKVKRQPLQ